VSDLQQIALRTNPLLRQAHLDIDAARGLALQAKLYPNPSIGYEASTVGQGNTDGNRSPGQQGGFYEQQIVTMGKLTLAHHAALRDVQINEQRLRQTEADVQAQVRAGYFAVLSAQKNYETTRSLAKLTDELYNVLLAQLRAGEVAAYEPMQIRVLAVQARASLIQSQNRYLSAWKQLAAVMGTPTLPLTAVAGKIDMSVPQFEHDRVLEYVLANHSDVQTAQLAVEKNRFLARLAEVQPYPDLTVHAAFQKDYTTPPFGTVANITVGLPFPLWNRNQGSIQAAQSQLQRALYEDQRVRNELTGKVAEAFERYQNNRALLKMYKDQILPNQVQAFRAAVARHAALGAEAGKVSYNDLVTSQQTLASLINNYLVALNDQWTSVVDISHLLQTRDLFQNQPLEEMAPVPEMHEIMRRGLLHRR
jgi:cobalt-zinc-cadmium efflux system outer membrane protein